MLSLFLSFILYFLSIFVPWRSSTAALGYTSAGVLIPPMYPGTPVTGRRVLIFLFYCGTAVGTLVPGYTSAGVHEMTHSRRSCKPVPGYSSTAGAEVAGPVRVLPQFECIYTNPLLATHSRLGRGTELS